MLLGLVVFSQTDTTFKKGFVGVNIGVSMSGGDYADADISYDEADFASTGVYYEINFGYYRFAANPSFYSCN